MEKRVAGCILVEGEDAGLLLRLMEPLLQNHSMPAETRNWLKQAICQDHSGRSVVFWYTTSGSISDRAELFELGLNLTRFQATWEELTARMGMSGFPSPLFEFSKTFSEECISIATDDSQWPDSTPRPEPAEEAEELSL